MKNIFTIVIILVGVFSYSQSNIDVKNIGTEDLEHMYNRLDPVSQVVIYHDNGNIYQKGFLKNDKLHGRWESFDNNGNLVETPLNPVTRQFKIQKDPVAQDK